MPIADTVDFPYTILIAGVQILAFIALNSLKRYIGGSYN